MWSSIGCGLHGIGDVPAFAAERTPLVDSQVTHEAVAAEPCRKHHALRLLGIDAKAKALMDKHAMMMYWSNPDCQSN